MNGLPPYLASEVSSRLLAIDPSLRRLLALPELAMTGDQLEKLLIGTWLSGYGAALEDVAAAGPAGSIYAWAQDFDWSDPR